MTVNRNNRNALKHGGAGALKEVQHGEPFTGLVAEAEARLVTELEAEGGRLGVVDKAARRLEVVARLYYGAFEKALNDSDLTRATALLKVYAWVQNSSIRALLALDEAERRKPKLVQNYIEVNDSETKSSNNE